MIRRLQLSQPGTLLGRPLQQLPTEQPSQLVLQQPPSRQPTPINRGSRHPGRSLARPTLAWESVLPATFAARITSARLCTCSWTQYVICASYCRIAVSTYKSWLWILSATTSIPRTAITKIDKPRVSFQFHAGILWPHALQSFRTRQSTRVDESTCAWFLGVLNSIWIHESTTHS